MTRLFLALSFVLPLLVLSCSTAGFAGLATESYTLELEKKTAAEIQQIKDEITKIKTVTGQLDTLLKDLEDTKNTIKDLEDRMKSMPRDNLKKIAEILQKYLDETD